MVGNGKEPMKNFSIILKPCYQCYAVADILKDQQELLFFSPLPQKNHLKFSASKISQKILHLIHLQDWQRWHTFWWWLQFSFSAAGSWQLGLPGLSRGRWRLRCRRAAQERAVLARWPWRNWSCCWRCRCDTRFGDEKKTGSAAVLFEYVFFWIFWKIDLHSRSSIHFHVYHESCWQVEFSMLYFTVLNSWSIEFHLSIEIIAYLMLFKPPPNLHWLWFSVRDGWTEFASKFETSAGHLAYHFGHASVWIQYCACQ